MRLRPHKIPINIFAETTPVTLRTKYLSLKRGSSRGAGHPGAPLRPPVPLRHPNKKEETEVSSEKSSDRNQVFLLLPNIMGPFGVHLYRYVEVMVAGNAVSVIVEGQLAQIVVLIVFIQVPGFYVMIE